MPGVAVSGVAVLAGTGVVVAGLAGAGDEPHADAVKPTRIVAAPANNEIRMHLATAMLKTGNKAGAKRELEMLTKLDKDSPIRADAEKMLSGL